MSCKCDPCCVVCIKVTSVTVGATATTLNETEFVLSELADGQKIELVVDPALLPVNALPVVLSDGTTTLPLEKENGSLMRENVFAPFCRCLAKSKGKCKDNAHVRMRYWDDEPHIIVYSRKRY